MDIGALILAGGKSRRMNGNNKAFLKFQNKSFIESIADRFAGFDNIYISVDEKEKYKHLSFTLIEDMYKDIGPIGGIYSALKSIEEKYIFVTACDMPKINREFINFVCDSLTEDIECIVTQDIKGRIYPLGGIYSKALLGKIEEMIKEEDYKLLNLIKRSNTKIISLSENNFSENILDNINDINDYNKLKVL
ncbi:molybdenum cofactor guanylyltransferase [Clostridium saccharoperbutylacetonicum]|uniref:molybdenum cofactor guanylyltransferase n=1 Tax=Clostridium saccharoperbutylacetonicum TaxID=36745 RepID=UPI000983B883|nr:molybdenum cofactor guanylyltransferase [Clostridium saccharoperbutylacetonicum]AQR95436.1 putative molybdenum cofactor guanylyltransferase [Clostridium saccharoperbutylacetonicum]NSB31295.1 molybdopterin-guanine dinucleotide biosynthesis protein A [Clostridium saccharoperbutylacetonicum]